MNDRLYEVRTSVGVTLMVKHTDGTPSMQASVRDRVTFSGTLVIALTSVRTSTLPPTQACALCPWKLSIPTAVSLCLCLEMPAADSASSMMNERFVVSIASSIAM